MNQVNGRRGSLVKWAGRRWSAGFTLLELVLVMIVVSVLATAAMERLRYYQERAEQMAMEETLAAIKMGLQVRLAELIMSNRTWDAVELERENPTRWLTGPPANYAGAYDNSPTAGKWYFAAESRQLVYVPNNRSYLQGGENGSQALRFQAKVNYVNVETPTGMARVPSSIALMPAFPYRWF